MTRGSRAVGVVVVTLLLRCTVSPLAAQSFQPVFTKPYVRQTGTPVTASDTFATCDPSGTFRIVVVNGSGGQDQIGTDPISSGSLSVNGIEVIHENDFSQNVTRIERSLSGLGPTNELGVRIRSGPSGAIQVTVEGIQSCGIRITSPAPGTTIEDSLILVRGTVPVPPTGQVGVTVNGVAGVVEGDRFAAIVPVDPTVTTLTAEASSLTATQSRDTIAVSVLATGEAPVRLLPRRPGGVAPLDTGFELSTTVGVVQVTLDADGDGVVDFQGATLADQMFAYPRPGLYVPIARVTADHGVVHSAATIVHVIDPAALDLHLQAVWNGLRDAIRAGNVADAARFLHTETRARYQAQLARLSPSALAAIDRHMTTIQLVEIGFAGAQYEMLRLRDGTELSFAVWFQLDADGLWRLRRF